MAVEQPIARVVGHKVGDNLAHIWRDAHGIFHGVTDLEEVSVEVHRVNDRASVDHPDADVVALRHAEIPSRVLLRSSNVHLPLELTSPGTNRQRSL